MFRKIYIWGVSPSTHYKTSDDFDPSLYTVFAAVGGRDRTLFRWEWLRRNALNSNGNYYTHATMRRYRRVAHVKRWQARILSVHRTLPEAQLELTKLRTILPGLITEVLK